MGRKSGVQFRAGGFWRVDDRSGFSVRATSTRKEWTQLIVDKKLWEYRHPQDFVKGVADDQTVPSPRPLAPNQFTGPIYIQIATTALIGATFLALNSIAGLSAGDPIGVMLDINQWFNTTILGNPVSTGINIGKPLPYQASSGNLVVDYAG